MLLGAFLSDQIHRLLALRSHFAPLKLAPARIARPRRHCGFTLVELLVVISIIGALMAMALPAINNARDAARRADCRNNLTQLSKAALAHLSNRGYFPTGGWGKNWVGESSRGYGASQPGGWIFNILPYMDQATLHEMDKDRTDAQIATINLERLEMPLPNVNCPSRRRTTVFPFATTGSNGTQPVNAASLTSKRVARSDYAINAGGQTACEFTTLGPATVAAAATFNWNVAGLATTGNTPNFEASTLKWKLGSASSTDTYATPPTGVSYLRSTVRDAHVLDGMANTYLVGEKFMNSNFYETGGDLGDNDTMYTGYSNDNFRTTGFLPVMDAAGSNAAGAAFTAVGSNPAIASAECRFGSPHSTGFHVAMCDGRVIMVRYNIERSVHQRLGDRRDQSNPSDSTY